MLVTCGLQRPHSLHGQFSKTSTGRECLRGSQGQMAPGERLPLSRGLDFARCVSKSLPRFRSDFAKASPAPLCKCYLAERLWGRATRRTAGPACWPVCWGRAVPSRMGSPGPPRGEASSISRHFRHLSRSESELLGKALPGFSDLLSLHIFIRLVFLEIASSYELP